MVSMSGATVDALLTGGRFWFFDVHAQIFYGNEEYEKLKDSDVYLLEASESWLSQFDDSQAVANYLAPMLPRLPQA